MAYRCECLCIAEHGLSLNAATGTRTSFGWTTVGQTFTLSEGVHVLHIGNRGRHPCFEAAGMTCVAGQRMALRLRLSGSHQGTRALALQAI